MTTRGFKLAESVQVGNWIADIHEPNDQATIDRVRGEVEQLTKRFPVYGSLIPQDALPILRPRRNSGLRLQSF
jgi:hypothetical protein